MLKRASPWQQKPRLMGRAAGDEAVRSPALAELLGLQEESSYGKLLRTMPRGLNEELGSASSWGRQSLLPLLLSVSDTTNRETFDCD